MNKEQLTTILQVCLFTFDGATKQEILAYNVYDPQFIEVGIKLCEYLQTIKVEVQQ